jgi:transposase
VAAARAAWPTAAAGGIGGIAPERLVFPDGCGVLTNLARLWGRSPRRARAVGTVPCGHRRRLTVLGALGIGGIVAATSVEAATSGAVFLAYLERVLPPELRRSRPDAVPVLDDLRAHETRAVRRLLDRSGFLYRYLPPYSPDLNPIEPAWAKLKAELRRVAARTTEALHQALGPALDAITAQDAAGFFRHAGYSRPNYPYCVISC